MINNFEEFPKCLNSIVMTWKCNWNCNFCIVSTHQRTDISDPIVRAMIIPAGDLVAIAGGEPGLAPKELLMSVLFVLRTKDCKIILQTNGLFVEKYPDLMGYFDFVQYHASYEYNHEIIPLERFEELCTKDCLVEYLIIAENDKYINFIKKHPDIYFTVVNAYNHKGKYLYNGEIPLLDNINKRSYSAPSEQEVSESLNSTFS